MNLRRLACLLLGAWLAIGAVLALIAIQNRRLMEESFTHLSPEVASQVKTIGEVRARLLFTHQLSDQARFYMEAWSTTQVVAAVLCLLVVLFATREGKSPLALAVLMLAVIVAQRLLLVPEISALSRLLEVEPTGPAGAKLATMRAIYYATEGFKVLVGLAVGLRLVTERRRSRHSRQHVDVIDKSDHRHIDR